MTKFFVRDHSVSVPENCEGRRNEQCPKAIGIVRPDISGGDGPRHALAVRRHAERLGYQYVYTVRPPADRADPIGYALAIAVGIDAAAIVIYDLTTVDHSPARVCDWCDLETVCPPETWARSRIAPDHAYPIHPLTVVLASRIMQQHKGCSAHQCPRKSAALTCLVRAGKIVPQTLSPRERAAARGIRLEPLAHARPTAMGPDVGTLLTVLNGLGAQPPTDLR